MQSRQEQFFEQKPEQTMLTGSSSGGGVLGPIALVAGYLNPGLAWLPLGSIIFFRKYTGGSA